MTLVANSANTPRYSHVFKKELWPEVGYCRESLTLTKLANMRVGSVLQSNGTYLLDAEAGSAITETLYVIADEAIYGVADGATVTVGCVVKGPVSIAVDNLHFGDTFDGTSLGYVHDKLEAQGFQLLSV